MNSRQVNKRHHICHAQLLKRHLSGNNSAIIMASHYANWELGTLSAGLQFSYQVVAFYKPLSNPWVDKFI